MEDEVMFGPDLTVVKDGQEFIVPQSFMIPAWYAELQEMRRQLLELKADVMKLQKEFADYRDQR